MCELRENIGVYQVSKTVNLWNLVSNHVARLHLSRFRISVKSSSLYWNTMDISFKSHVALSRGMIASQTNKLYYKRNEHLLFLSYYVTTKFPSYSYWIWNLIFRYVRIDVFNFMFLYVSLIFDMTHEGCTMSTSKLISL